MKFLYYLNERVLPNYLKKFEHRTQYISENKARELIRAHCKRGINSTIYRAFSRYMDTEPYAFIDPTKSNEPRVSRNTENYYTLIIDNDPRWKKFPRRSKSIICSTDKNRASSYGSVFRVIPYDTAKIGIVPASDIFYGFDLVSQKAKGSMAIFNNDLQQYIRFAGSKDPKTYAELLKTLDKVGEYIKKETNNGQELKKKSYGWIKSLTLYDYNPAKDGRFRDYILKMFDPMANGFKLVSAGTELPAFREVWTEGPAVMIFDEGKPSSFESFKKTL